MGLHDLFGGSLSCSFIKEEVTSCLSLLVLHLDGVILDKRSHESVVSLLAEPFRQYSLIATGRSMLRFPSGKILNLTHLDISLII